MSEMIFAYGSNMCSGRFRAYEVLPEGEGVAAQLNGYCLQFNKWSQKDHSGKATVTLTPGGQVWGVVYSIPDADLKTLDSGEGRGYYRTRLTVRCTSGETVDAWVYLASKPSSDSELRPYT